MRSSSDIGVRSDSSCEGPGSFGGSDAHRYHCLQSYYSMDWDSYRYKSRMPYGWDPSAKWGESNRCCAVVRMPMPSAPERARVALRLPHPDAELWIGLKKANGAGLERAFETPALETGKNYEYEFIARWLENGAPKAESRSVTVRCGDSIEIDFTLEK